MTGLKTDTGVSADVVTLEAEGEILKFSDGFIDSLLSISGRELDKEIVNNLNQ